MWQQATGRTTKAARAAAAAAQPRRRGSMIRGKKKKSKTHKKKLVFCGCVHVHGERCSAERLQVNAQL